MHSSEHILVHWVTGRIQPVEKPVAAIGTFSAFDPALPGATLENRLVKQITKVVFSNVSSM